MASAPRARVTTPHEGSVGRTSGPDISRKTVLDVPSRAGRPSSRRLVPNLAAVRPSSHLTDLVNVMTAR